VLAGDAPHNAGNPKMERMRDPLLRDEIRLIVHFTRNWIHYGTIAFVCACVFGAALKGIAG